VVLHIWDGAPDPSQPYLRYELKNVIVTSLTTGGHGDDRPTETLSLNDEEIKVQTVRPGVRPPVIPPLPRVPPPAPGRAGGR
jgi:type VI protein secretion system component Hcp